MPRSKADRTAWCHSGEMSCITLIGKGCRRPFGLLPAVRFRHEPSRPHALGASRPRRVSWGPSWGRLFGCLRKPIRNNSLARYATLPLGGGGAPIPRTPDLCCPTRSDHPLISQRENLSLCPLYSARGHLNPACMLGPVLGPDRRPGWRARSIVSSAKKVEKLTKPGRHADGGGLYLAISRDGSRRRWVFLYRDKTARQAAGDGSWQRPRGQPRRCPRLGRPCPCSPSRWSRPAGRQESRSGDPDLWRDGRRGGLVVGERVAQPETPQAMALHPNGALQGASETFP